MVVASAVLTVMLSALTPASATTPAGWIDTTYGSGGVSNLTNGALVGTTIVDGTGRALILGITNAAGSGGQIARLTAGGQADGTFNGTGTASLPAAFFYTRLAIGPGGLIYALGSDAATNGTKIVVTRVTDAGLIDTAAFGTSGTATLALPTGMTLKTDALAVRNDSDVVISVATNDTTNTGYLTALTAAGVLDTTFGTAGVAALPAKEFAFKLAAAAAPIAPAFTASTPPTSAIKGLAYSYTFAASGRPAPTFSSTGTLPTGLTLDPNTGVLSGTPTATGTFTFTVTATNSAGFVTTPSITITVVPPQTPPSFTSATPPTTATVGVAYTYTFVASGNPAPVFSVASGSLPPGLTLNSSGVLSGTPTAGGTFTFTVKAANNVSPDATTGPLSIAVAAAPLFVAQSPPTSATKGSPYSYTFTASGNPAPTFALNSGALPTGLTLSSSGVLSGTPTVVGQSTFTVKATNGVSPNATSNSITITVSATPFAPSFTADTPPPTAKVGVPYSYTFAAIGNPTPTFIALGTIPTGLTLNSTTGVMSGTPTVAHAFSFRVEATNGVGSPAISPLITITVARAGAAAAAQPAASSPRAATPAAKAATATVADPNKDVVALVANDNTNPRTYVLQRYHSDGSLDTAFGTGGSTVAFPASASPVAVAEAADSSYYVTGNSGQSVFLSHVLSNGQFDAAFGTGGTLVGPVESCKPTGGLIVFSPAGDVYVIALNNDNTCGRTPAIVMRFHNGALDATFGAGGEVRVDSIAAFRVNGPNGGGIQPSGQILVGLDGTAAAAAGAQVARVNATAAGPTVEAFTQLVDDSHFAAATVAANPAGTYIGPVGAARDSSATTHVFATGANHHLYEFNQTGATWSAPIDLTVGAALPVSSAPKAIFDGTYLDVFALGATGNLIVYRNNGAQGAWLSTDVNAAAGTGSPQVTNLDPHFIAGILRVYGQTAAGHMVEIDNDNGGGHAWNFYDQSALAGGGTAIAGGPAAIDIAGTPHVYTRAASNGDLIEYVADHAGGNIWNAYDTTAAAAPAPAIVGNPVPTLITNLNGTQTPHIYTVAAGTGDLVEFVADHLNPPRIWNAYDQTTTAGAPKPVGNPSVILISGAPYGIAIQIPEVWETIANGDVTTFVADHAAPGPIWNTYDATALSGGPGIAGDPTPIVGSDGTVQVFGLGKAATGAGGGPVKAATASSASRAALASFRAP